MAALKPGQAQTASPGPLAVLTVITYGATICGAAPGEKMELIALPIKGRVGVWQLTIPPSVETF